MPPKRTKKVRLGISTVRGVVLYGITLFINSGYSLSFFSSCFVIIMIMIIIIIIIIIIFLQGAHITKLFFSGALQIIRK